MTEQIFQKNSERYAQYAVDFFQNKYIPFLNQVNVNVWLQIIDNPEEVLIYANTDAVALFGTGSIAKKIAEDVYYSDFNKDIKQLSEISGGMSEISRHWQKYEEFLGSTVIESFHAVYPILNPEINEVKWVDANGTALIRGEDGLPVVVGGIFTDITDDFSSKCRSQQSLRQLQEMTSIFRAGEAIGKFGFIEYNFEELPGYVKCTDAAVRIFGWEQQRSSLYPQENVLDAIFEKDNLKQEAHDRFNKFIAGEGEYKQVICPLVNGLWVELNATELEFYIDGRVKRAVCSVVDITANYVKHEEVEALNDIFHEAEKTGQFGSYEFNRGKYANKFCITENGARILGITPNKNNLYTLKEFSSTLTATESKDYVKEVTDNIHNISSGVINSFNIKSAVRVNNEIRWVKLSAHAKSYGADGQIATSIGAIVDITENMCLLKKTETLAFNDTMTGLLNKNALQRDFANSSNDLYTHYLFADINGFKAINDHFGHLFGDYCLEALARRIEEYNSLNPHRTFKAYRIYGDEFVFACKVSAEAGIEERITHLMLFMDKSYAICAQKINIELSVGIIENACHESSLEEMLCSVDQAMYIAKNNKVKYYILGRDEKNFGFVINKYLSASVLPEDVAPYYQAIFDINSDRIIGYEFFSRLRIDDNLVNPADFFVQAKEKSRMPEIDRIVLRRVFDYLAGQDQEALADKKLFFNIDVQTVTSNRVIDFVEGIIAKYNIDPENIFFEFNEKVGLINLLRSEVIQKIKGMGISVILDDFSACDYSLAAINNYDFSYVKLAKGLLREVMRDERMRTIYTCLSELIRNHGIEIIAQGVEEEEHLELLRECHINFAQGYYLSKTENLDSFADEA